jgi:hypothetical protein
MRFWLLGFLLGLTISIPAMGASSTPRHTSVSIVGEEFYINGKATYSGRSWHGHKLQGLLLNARLVQGIFDDRNTNTVAGWSYPDTGKWDAERNTREFVAAMTEWRQNGLLAFTINLQGGSPRGYVSAQPWHNSAFEEDGSIRPDYMARLERIVDRADELGMVVILGYFYFGQDQRLRDEAAVLRATANATRWIFDHSWGNVLVEINNECNVRYTHSILQPARIHELIHRVQAARKDGRRLLVSASYGGGSVPQENVARAADFLLLHGNGVSDPKRIGEMVLQTRAVAGYTRKPILFNEDDHYDFEKPENNFYAAVAAYASWGLYDQGTNNYLDGFQSPPVNWKINTLRKEGFFRLVDEMTGGATK